MQMVMCLVDADDEQKLRLVRWFVDIPTERSCGESAPSPTEMVLLAGTEKCSIDSSAMGSQGDRALRGAVDQDGNGRAQGLC